MIADINVLHRSDFYEIRNFKCSCTTCSVSATEYNDSFYICFVRSGFFNYRIFRKELDVHIGRVLISKPNYEYVTHHINDQPDVCSVFDFKQSFFDRLSEHYGSLLHWYFKNPDIHSVLINANPQIEYYHRFILNKLFHQQQDNLLIDELVIDLVDRIMQLLGNSKEPPPLSNSLKRHHLATIEKATNFILERFDQNITLQALADHCCVSTFHFSRIFKSILHQSPYKYLSSIRLTHAKMLLETTRLPVTQIAFQCGFNSLEQFSTVYRQHFKTSPIKYRKGVTV